MTQRCTRCSEVRPDTDFPYRKDRARRTTICKFCCNAARRGKHDPQVQRWHTLQTRYKLDREKWLELFERQGFSCAICGAVEPGGQGTWHVDHDHNCCPTPKGKNGKARKYRTCGKCVRGLLCHLCNTGLGCARDDPAVLQKMIDYLTVGAFDG